MIACANVFSDLYAMGATEMQSVLMILGGSDKIERLEHRETVLKLLMEGFCAGARLAGTSVGGGQTILNASPIIGGVASAVVPRDRLVRNDRIHVGDYLVLTKPLGMDTAVRSYQNLPEGFPVEPTAIASSYALAVRCMAHLNKIAGGFLRRHNATGATDVTGYGLVGHAENLASIQLTPVAFRFFLLPCIHSTVNICVNGETSRNTKLLSGRAVETSGGLLAAFRTVDAADAYLDAVRKSGKTEGWVVGRAVEAGDRAAFVQATEEDTALVHARYAHAQTIPLENATDVMHVLEVTEADVFLPDAPNPCCYDHTALAKRLS